MKTIIQSVTAIIAFLVLSVSAFAAPVNINTATADEISEALSGVGPVKAQSIVAYRDAQANGKIAVKEELKDIKGIGDKTYESIAADVYLNDASMPK